MFSFVKPIKFEATFALIKIHRIIYINGLQEKMSF